MNKNLFFKHNTPGVSQRDVANPAKRASSKLEEEDTPTVRSRVDSLTEKLNMWRGKLTNLEEEHKSIMVRKGEAAAMGDLRENAAYQTLVEDSETWRVKISEVKKIIAKIEADMKGIN